MFGFGGKIETVIGEGAHIKGSLKCGESVFVNGKVEGDVSCEGVLTLGAKAMVRGDLKAPVVIVGGKIEGDIEAAERVELLPTAVIGGDIRAPKLITAEGAILQGRCEMVQPSYERVEKAEGKAAARRANTQA